MQGWCKSMPGKSKNPAPVTLLLLYASMFVEWDEIEAAMCLLIQLDTYMRPTAAIELRWSSVVIPFGALGGLGSADSSVNKWAFVLGNSDLGETTKSGTIDDTVLLGTDTRDFIVDVWERYAEKYYADGARIFPGLTLSKYEKLFTKAGKLSNTAALHVTPHVVRHTAPSHDFLVGSRTIPEIKARGQWAHDASVRRYQQSGRLLLQSQKLSAAQVQLCTRASASLFDAILTAID